MKFDLFINGMSYTKKDIFFALRTVNLYGWLPKMTDFFQFFLLRINTPSQISGKSVYNPSFIFKDENNSYVLLYLLHLINYVKFLNATLLKHIFSNDTTVRFEVKRVEQNNSYFVKQLFKEK